MARLASGWVWGWLVVLGRLRTGGRRRPRRPRPGARARETTSTAPRGRAACRRWRRARAGSTGWARTRARSRPRSPEAQAYFDQGLRAHLRLQPRRGRALVRQAPPSSIPTLRHVLLGRRPHARAQLQRADAARPRARGLGRARSGAGGCAAQATPGGAGADRRARQALQRARAAWTRRRWQPFNEAYADGHARGRRSSSPPTTTCRCSPPRR